MDILACIGADLEEVPNLGKLDVGTRLPALPALSIEPGGLDVDCQKFQFKDEVHVFIFSGSGVWVSVGFARIEFEVASGVYFGCPSICFVMGFRLGSRSFGMLSKTVSFLSRARTLNSKP